jgi:ribonuclease Z
VDLDVVFLGTSGGMPSARRNPAGILVRRGGERLLFDCGEGTQRQLLQSTVGLVDLAEIFLTHFHADHYLGLPGMLKTFALRGRELPLTVYGPPGLRDLFGSLRRIFGRLTYPIELVEIGAGDVLDGRDGYAIVPFTVVHGVSALGYALVEEQRPGRFDVRTADALGVPNGPERGALQRGEIVTLADGRTVAPDAVLGPPRAGRKVVLSGDTAPSSAVVEAARRADLLVHEGTFCDDELERAVDTRHSTVKGAALVARQAEVGLLALTHVSPRYFARQVLDEARAVFEATVLPRDFDMIEVRFEERGGAELLKGGALPPREEEHASG